MRTEVGSQFLKCTRVYEAREIEAQAVGPIEEAFENLLEPTSWYLTS